MDTTPSVPCDCGCGTLLPPRNTKGKPSRFAHGHNNRTFPQSAMATGEPPRPKRTPEEQLEARRASRRRSWARHYARNREQQLERTRYWRANNPEKVRVYNAWYRENHGDAIAQQTRAYRDSEVYQQALPGYRAAARAATTAPSRRIKRLLSNAKRRSRATGIEFDEALCQTLTVDPPVDCPCCGLALDYTYTLSKGKGFAARSPSLDRTDNSRGYVSGNVAVICLRCNLLKRDATLADLELVVAYLRRCSP